jgi:ribonuclease HI
LATGEPRRDEASKGNRPSVLIYTDGSRKGNPGPGGLGAWLRSGTHERELVGGAAATTNQRMELTAAVEALTALKRPSNVVIYTDSLYVLKGIANWIVGWRRNSWQNSAKKPVGLCCVGAGGCGVGTLTR